MNRSLFFAFFALAAPAASAAPAAQVEAALRAGHYAEALALMRGLPLTDAPEPQRVRQVAVAAILHDWGDSLLTADPAAALPHYEAALTIDRALSLEATADLLGMGSADEAIGRPARALDLFRQALASSRKLKDPNGQAGALAGIAMADADLGRLGPSVASHRLALALFKRQRDRDGEAKVLVNLADVYVRLKRPAQALNLYRQALPLLRAVSDEEGEAVALAASGGAHKGLPQSGRAAAPALVQRALPGAKQAGDRKQEAKALANMGNVYGGLGRYREALDCYRQALPLFRQAGDRTDAARLGTNISLTQRRMKGR